MCKCSQCVDRYKKLRPDRSLLEGEMSRAHVRRYRHSPDIGRSAWQFVEAVRHAMISDASGGWLA
jgi:hypothetical protein